jgi:MFS family permease
MVVAMVAGMSAFVTFPALLPTFQQEWALSNTQAGWISGIFFAGYVLAVPVLTSLTDRIDPRRVFLAAMALSALATAGFGLMASGAWSASFWRLLQGVGFAGTYMPGLFGTVLDLGGGAATQQGWLLAFIAFTVVASLGATVLLTLATRAPQQVARS